MKALRGFIREELVGNYRMRGPTSSRPHSNKDVDDRRHVTFDDMPYGPKPRVIELHYAIESADDVDQLYDAMDHLNCDPRDIVVDVAKLERALGRADIEAVRIQLLMGLHQLLRASASSYRDGTDAFSLQGHPLRHVKGGGPSLKRSM